MKSSFFIFFSIISIILSAVVYYVGQRYIMNWPWAAEHRRVVWSALVALVLLQISGPVLYRVMPDVRNRVFIMQWIAYSAMGIVTTMFLYVAAADVILAIWKFFSSSENHVNLERRGFFTVSTLIAGSAAIGAWQVFRGPKVYEVEIPIKNLPEAFNGFKIVQISDLHVGPTIGRAYAEDVVRIANSLSPDLLALTGDFIDGSVNQLKDSVAPLKNLQAPYGKFFVTGNHEYYWDVDSWLAEFTSLGMRALNDEHVLIKKDNSEIILAGVTDLSSSRMHPTHQSSPQNSIRGAPLNLPKILLAHHPNSFKDASEAGFDLQLSGHTHGGQFFPWSLFVIAAHRYYKGLSLHEKMWIYVNRGTGYWGPPFRFTVPAEITLVKLKTAT